MKRTINIFLTGLITATLVLPLVSLSKETVNSNANHSISLKDSNLINSQANGANNSMNRLTLGAFDDSIYATSEVFYGLLSGKNFDVNNLDSYFKDTGAATTKYYQDPKKAKTTWINFWQSISNSTLFGKDGIMIQFANGEGKFNNVPKTWMNKNLYSSWNDLFGPNGITNTTNTSNYQKMILTNSSDKVNNSLEVVNNFYIPSFNQTNLPKDGFTNQQFLDESIQIIASLVDFIEYGINHLSCMGEVIDLNPGHVGNFLNSLVNVFDKSNITISKLTKIGGELKYLGDIDTLIFTTAEKPGPFLESFIAKSNATNLPSNEVKQYTLKIAEQDFSSSSNIFRILVSSIALSNSLQKTSGLSHMLGQAFSNGFASLGSNAKNFNALEDDFFSNKFSPANNGLARTSQIFYDILTKSQIDPSDSSLLGTNSGLMFNLMNYIFDVDHKNNPFAGLVNKTYSEDLNKSNAILNKVNNVQSYKDLMNQISQLGNAYQRYTQDEQNDFLNNSIVSEFNGPAQDGYRKVINQYFNSLENYSQADSSSVETNFKNSTLSKPIETDFNTIVNKIDAIPDKNSHLTIYISLGVGGGIAIIGGFLTYFFLRRRSLTKATSNVNVKKTKNDLDHKNNRNIL